MRNRRGYEPIGEEMSRTGGGMGPVLIKGHVNLF
jgi:hypothetical protein